MVVVVLPLLITILGTTSNGTKGFEKWTTMLLTKLFHLYHRPLSVRCLFHLNDVMGVAGFY